MSGSGDMLSRERDLYRSDRAHAHSSSDDSSDGEEDTPLWRQKQEKYFRKKKSSTEAMCASPSKTDPATVPAPAKKKSNNIWGSVLTEQDLTQTMVRSAAVDKPEELSFNERNVESYDFTKKYNDRRQSWDEMENPDGRNVMIETVHNIMSVPAQGRAIIDYEDTLQKTRDSRDRCGNFSRKNRKRRADNSNEREQRSSIHDRIGVKKLATTRLGEIDMSVDMETSELTKKIAEFLHEPKEELIERIVTHVGKDFAIRLVQATKDVEESGGMYTLDGSRRRTPGGVYLTLLKQQPEWSKDVRKLVFVEDEQELVKKKREKRKKARQQRRRNQAGKQNDGEGNSGTRSRSNSNSRSRSNSNSSSKSTPHKKGDVVEAMEDGDEKSESKVRKSSGDFKHKHRHNLKYESSEDEYENRQKSTRSKPFNFEDELAAAKKLILEKSNSQNKTGTEVMESESVDNLDKDTFSEMTDLETAEANVVDIELGIDGTG